MTTHTSESRLVSIARQGSQWLATVTTSSLLYGWLTEEPDPDVIIIDLRKTWTVGPFITLIDAFIEWIAPIWRASQLAGLAAKAAGTGEYLADTRYGRILIELLEHQSRPNSAPILRRNQQKETLTPAETSDTLRKVNRNAWRLCEWEQASQHDDVSPLEQRYYPPNEADYCGRVARRSCRCAKFMP